MVTYIHYATTAQGAARKLQDIDACEDILNYVGAKNYSTLRAGADGVNAGLLTIKELRFVFDMIGVSGYPVGAFLRTFCLKAYREWMHSNDREGPVWTDEDGFPLSDTE